MPAPILIGHRGARGLFPENTLEGLAASIALGLRHIEIDIAMTADGVPVLSHDAVLHPDITRLDGVWLDAPGPPIQALTLAALRRYDVGRIRPGSAYAAAHPDQRPIDGARIPTLAEVLALAPAPNFVIELKLYPDRPALTASPAAMTDAVLAVTDAAGATGRVTIQSFDWRPMAHLRRHRPDVARAYLTEPETEAAAALWWDMPDPPADIPSAVHAAGGATQWAPHYAALDRATIDRAHALGLRVVPWTVNDTDDMERLAAWGVDGLITDRPDRAPPHWLGGA